MPLHPIDFFGLQRSSTQTELSLLASGTMRVSDSWQSACTAPAVILLVMACGCSSTGARAPEVGLGHEAEEVVPIRRVLDEHARRGTAIYSRRQAVLRTELQWRALWTEMRRNYYPPGDLPGVDFSREMLVFVAMGGRPTYGYSIAIDRVFRRRDTLFAAVRETCPAKGAIVAPTGSAPVDVVAVARDNVDVVFLNSSQC